MPIHTKGLFEFRIVARQIGKKTMVYLGTVKLVVQMSM